MTVMKRIIDQLNRKSGPQRAEIDPLDALPNFQNFTYRFAVKPEGSHIVAWAKLCEAERRLAMYEWVERHNDPANPQHRILLDDSVSAFLLTFEAAIQFLKDQFKRSGTGPKFDSWFAEQPQNDVCIKGLRTLRLFEAHVEEKPIPRTVDVHAGSSLDGEKPGARVTGCMWRLPQLDPEDLAKLHSPKLALAELNDWNSLVGNQEAKKVFADGISKLKDVLDTAESIIWGLWV
jgi:hypothetical protein